jgi:hypothetical protein
MTVAFHLLVMLSRRSGELTEGDERLASGGSTTTLVSATLTEADDAWNGRTLFITADAAGAGAAPELESRPITDFVASTDTLTVSPAFSIAVASGDKFAIGSRKYNKTSMLAALSSAFRWFGPMPQEDQASLTTAADTIEYTLPTTVPDNGLREVLIATNTASPYDFMPLSYWQVDYGARKLVLDHQPDYPYLLKLKYHGLPAGLTVDSTAIDSIYNGDMLDAIIEYAMTDLLLRRIQKTANPSKSDLEKYNLAAQQAKAKKDAVSMPQSQKQPRYWYTNQTSNVSDFRLKIPGE